MTEITPPLIIDACYNEETKQFEVFSIDEASGVKFTMLTQTHEDIIQQLKQMVVNTLTAISQVEQEIKE
jgi:hypothetical protein